MDLMQTNFTGGEWSDLLDGQVLQAKYKNAVRRMENMLVYPHGPATKRPGTRFVAAAKSASTRARLLPFVPSESAAYVCEFGERYARFYRDGRVLGDYGNTRLWLRCGEKATLFDVTFNHAPDAVGNVTAAGYAVEIRPGSQDSYIELAASADWQIGAVNWTFDTWVTLEGLKPSDQVDIMFQESPGVGFQRLNIVRSGNTGNPLLMIFQVNAPGGAVSTGYTELAIAQGTRFHVQVTRAYTGNANEMNVLVNGAHFSSGTITGTLPLFTGPMKIGKGNAVDGKVRLEELRWSYTRRSDAPVAPPYPLTQEMTPYEIATPYAAADVRGLKYCQSVDSMYLFHPHYPVQRLSRISTKVFDISPVVFDPPPTTEKGHTPATTLALSAKTGTITLTAGASSFIAGDVGRVVKAGGGRCSISVVTNATTATATVIDMFDTTTYGSGQWRMLLSPIAGLTPSSKGPAGSACTLTSTVDVFRPGDAGKYVHINSGIVKITFLTHSSLASGEIVKELESTSASSVWRLQSETWNSVDGYPSCGTFYEDRLICAGAPGNPENVRASKTSSYEDFTTGAEDDDGLDLTLSGRSVNTVRWVEPREYLICGTHSGEWKIGPDDTGRPMTPTNRIAKLQTTFGCADIMPQTIESSTMFVQRAQRKIREFTWQYEKDGYVAPDMTLLAEHLTAGGVQAMAYQQEPLSVLFTILQTGELLGMTYMRDQDVVAWHKHPMAGEVEDGVTVPGIGEDEVWLLVKRTVAGSDKRYIERMASLFADDATAYAENKGLNAYFVDCGITYDGPETEVTRGLVHLEGETVAILGDGANYAAATVEDGQVALPWPASVVHVGLPYRALIQTMRPEIETREGTIQGRVKRVIDAIIRVHVTGPFQTGRDEDHLTPVTFRTSDMPMDAAPALYTGDMVSQTEGGIDRFGRIVIAQDNPMPLTVVAIIKKIGVY